MIKIIVYHILYNVVVIPAEILYYENKEIKLKIYKFNILKIVK